MGFDIVLSGGLDHNIFSYLQRSEELWQSGLFLGHFPVRRYAGAFGTIGHTRRCIRWDYILFKTTMGRIAQSKGELIFLHHNYIVISMSMSWSQPDLKIKLISRILLLSNNRSNHVGDELFVWRLAPIQFTLKIRVSSFDIPLYCFVLTNPTPESSSSVNKTKSQNSTFYYINKSGIFWKILYTLDDSDKISHFSFSVAFVYIFTSLSSYWSILKIEYWFAMQCPNQMIYLLNIFYSIYFRCARGLFAYVIVFIALDRYGKKLLYSYSSR